MTAPKCFAAALPIAFGGGCFAFGPARRKPRLILIEAGSAPDVLGGAIVIRVGRLRARSRVAWTARKRATAPEARAAQGVPSPRVSQGQLAARPRSGGGRRHRYRATSLNSRIALRPAVCRLERPVDAVTDVIVDKRLLGILDRALHRLQLLGDLRARPALLKHFDDLLQMAVGAFQAFDDRWVVAVLHRDALSSREDTKISSRDCNFNS
jgi:hypothetical protein